MMAITRHFSQSVGLLALAARAADRHDPFGRLGGSSWASGAAITIEGPPGVPGGPSFSPARNEKSVVAAQLAIALRQRALSLLEFCFMQAMSCCWSPMELRQNFLASDPQARFCAAVCAAAGSGASEAVRARPKSTTKAIITRFTRIPIVILPGLYGRFRAFPNKHWA